MAARLTAGTLVSLVAPGGATLAVVPPCGAGDRWELAPLTRAPGDALPTSSLFVVLRSGEALGFRSLGCVLSTPSGAHNGPVAALPSPPHPATQGGRTHSPSERNWRPARVREL